MNEDVEEWLDKLNLPEGNVPEGILELRGRKKRVSI